MGGMLLDPSAAERARRIVAAPDFYVDSHRILFVAVTRLMDAGAALDPVTLSDALTAAGELERAGGYGALSSLLDAVPSAENIEHHARIVRRHACQRHLADAGALLAAEPTSPIAIAAVQAAARNLDACNAAVRSRLVRDDEMERRPPPEFLIDGVLPAGGLACLAGPPGCGKTFVALDWALSVSTGTWWQGREVKQGPVVYVAAEGSAGLGSRVRAWKRHHGYYDFAGVHFLPESVSLTEPAEAGRLRAEVSTLNPPPALVVLDTLARTMLGDENSAGDMGRYIAEADRIRSESGAAVLVLHHMNASGERERGSTALRGAVDVLAILKPGEDGEITLECAKQKEAEPFRQFRLALDRIDLGDTSSCAIVGITEARYLKVEGISDFERIGLTALDTHFGELGASASEWLTVVESKGMPRATFFRTRKNLLDKGFVECPATGKRGQRYTLSPAGRAALGIKVSQGIKSVSTPAVGRYHAPPLFRGGANDTETQPGTVDSVWEGVDDAA